MLLSYVILLNKRCQEKSFTKDVIFNIQFLIVRIEVKRKYKCYQVVGFQS